MAWSYAKETFQHVGKHLHKSKGNPTRKSQVKIRKTTYLKHHCNENVQEQIKRKKYIYFSYVFLLSFPDVTSFADVYKD